MPPPTGELSGMETDSLGALRARLVPIVDSEVTEALSAAVRSSELPAAPPIVVVLVVAVAEECSCEEAEVRENSD